MPSPTKKKSAPEESARKKPVPKKLRRAESEDNLSLKELERSQNGIYLKPAKFQHTRSGRLGVGKGARTRISHPGNTGCYTLSYVNYGWIEVVVDKVPHRVEAGHAIFLKPGHEERYELGGENFSIHSWCCVQKGEMPPDLINRLAPVSGPVVLDSFLYLRLLFETVLSSPLAASETGEASFERQAFCLFYEFLRMMEMSIGLPQQSPASISKVVGYLHEHLGEPLELRSVAKAVGITPHHIIRLFRTHLNETPIRYLWNLRARRGADLLKHTSLSISEIAYEVGFQSPFHFSRVIKETYGVSPKSFREKHQRGEKL